MLDDLGVLEAFSAVRHVFAASGTAVQRPAIVGFEHVVEPQLDLCSIYDVRTVMHSASTTLARRADFTHRVTGFTLTRTYHLEKTSDPGSRRQIDTDGTKWQGTFQPDTP